MVSQRTQRRRRRRRRDQRSIAPEPGITGAYSELTVPGNYAFGGIDYRELLNQKPVRPEEIQLMVDIDGHARALFNAIKRPILRNAQRVFIKPPSKDKGLEEAEFISSNLLSPRHEGGMTIPFVKQIAHMCTAFLFGFKVFEKQFDRPGTVIDDGRIRLRKLAPRDSRTITFIVDDKGGLDGIKQRTSWRGRIIDRELNRDRMVYFAIDEEESPFYGKSIFLPSYYHFDKKHKLYYITHLALAVGAMAPRMAKAKPAIPEADKQKFLEALSNLGTNAAMLVPDGFELLDQQLASGSTSSLPFMEMIRHHDLMMSQSLLAQVVDVGTSERGGGFSLSKNHLDMLNMAIESMMFDMGEMYNNFVIPELIEWNFGSGLYPRLVFPPLTEDIKDATSEIFHKMITARESNLSPEFAAEIEKEMADTLGLEVDSAAIEANQLRIAAQRELEKAMEEANEAIGQDVTKMSADQLLQEPKFIAWAEAYTERVRSRTLIGARTSDDDGDVDV